MVEVSFVSFEELWPIVLVEVSFVGFEEIIIDVAFMADVVEALVVSFLVMFEAPPALAEGIKDPFYYFYMCIHLIFSILIHLLQEAHIKT